MGFHTTRRSVLDSQLLTPLPHHEAFHVCISFADYGDTSSEDWSPVSTFRGPVKHADVPQRLTASGNKLSNAEKQITAAPWTRKTPTLHLKADYDKGSQLQQKILGMEGLAMLPTRDKEMAITVQPVPERGSCKDFYSGWVDHGKAPLVDARLQEDLQAALAAGKSLMIEILIPSAICAKQAQRTSTQSLSFAGWRTWHGVPRFGHRAQKRQHCRLNGAKACRHPQDSGLHHIQSSLQCAILCSTKGAKGALAQSFSL